MKAINKHKLSFDFSTLLYIYICVQPVIDLITSLYARNTDGDFSLGMLIRTLLMISFALYAFIISSRKHKFIELLIYGLIGLYALIFLYVQYNSTGLTYFTTHLNGLIKTFYFPVILISLYFINLKNKISINKRAFVISLTGYTLVIFLARILGIAYNSYITGLSLGTVGLYYAANEIGITITILASFLFYKVLKADNKFSRKNIYTLVALILYIYAALELGTKVPFLGLCSLLTIYLITSIIYRVKTKEKKYNFKIASFFIIVISIGLLIGFTPIGKNLNITPFEDIYTPKKDFSGVISTPVISLSNDEIETTSPDVVVPDDYVPSTLTSNILSGRDWLLEVNKQKYENSDNIQKLFGIGYVDKETISPLKLVEMDYFDILFCQGIIGFIIYFAPLIFILIVIIKDIIKNIKILLDAKVLFLGFSVGIALVSALVAGHVLSAPAVSTYLAFIIILLYNRLKKGDAV